MVHAADIQDRDGAKIVFKKIKKYFTKLELIWADGGYAEKLIVWARRYCGWELTIIKRSDRQKGFKILPRRWVVERTFAWLSHYRRLSKDYEYRTDTSEIMICLAITHLMLRRLSRNQGF